MEVNSSHGVVKLDQKYASQAQSDAYDGNFIIKRSELRSALDHKGLPNIIGYEYEDDLWFDYDIPIYGDVFDFVHLYVWDDGKLSIDDDFIRVKVTTDGTEVLTIGCVSFDAENAKKVIKWAKALKTKKKPARKKKLTRPRKK
jgi:hypothetical protein